VRQKGGRRRTTARACLPCWLHTNRTHPCALYVSCCHCPLSTASPAPPPPRARTFLTVPATLLSCYGSVTFGRGHSSTSPFCLPVTPLLFFRMPIAPRWQAGRSAGEQDDDACGRLDDGGWVGQWRAASGDGPQFHLFCLYGHGGGERTASPSPTWATSSSARFYRRVGAYASYSCAILYLACCCVSIAAPPLPRYARFLFTQPRVYNLLTLLLAARGDAVSHGAYVAGGGTVAVATLRLAGIVG